MSKLINNNVTLYNQTFQQEYIEFNFSCFTNGIALLWNTWVQLQITYKIMSDADQ